MSKFPQKTLQKGRRKKNIITQFLFFTLFFNSSFYFVISILFLFFAPHWHSPLPSSTRERTSVFSSLFYHVSFPKDSSNRSSSDTKFVPFRHDINSTEFYTNISLPAPHFENGNETQKKLKNNVKELNLYLTELNSYVLNSYVSLFLFVLIFP